MFNKKKDQEIEKLKEVIKNKNNEIENLNMANMVFKDIVKRIYEMKEKYQMKVIFFDDTKRSSFEAPAIQAVKDYLKEKGHPELSQEEIFWMVRCFNTHYPVVSCSLNNDTRWESAQKEAGIIKK